MGGILERERLGAAYSIVTVIQSQRMGQQYHFSEKLLHCTPHLTSAEEVGCGRHLGSFPVQSSGVRMGFLLCFENWPGGRCWLARSRQADAWVISGGRLAKGSSWRALFLRGQQRAAENKQTVLPEPGGGVLMWLIFPQAPRPPLTSAASVAQES